ncbi:MAG TPA: hypothetical protein VFB43_12600 [Terracidiphilus sp.]|nr:hypothetical protein [Terracidiphilus sp.]
MSPLFARLGRRSRFFLFTSILLPLVPTSLHAKTAGLTAIAIYPGHDGQDYQQIADFVLNGKNEVNLCTATSGIDKSAYHKLGKAMLTADTSIERTSDGVLMLTQGAAAPVCVVPGNLKFEKGGSFSASELADKAEIEGRVINGSDSSATQIVPIKPGAKIVFVAAPDQELAEYLRADRAGTIHGWQVYLQAYPAGAHGGAAKRSLAMLFLADGASALQTYAGSKGGSSPNYGKLKDARQAADHARALVADDAAIAELSQKIHAEVLALSAGAQEKLNLYQQAFKQQAPGYANLVAAEKLADGAYATEPTTPEAAAAENATRQARVAYNGILHDCEAQIAAQQADEAAQKIALLHGFAAEDANVAADIKAVSALYVANAKKLEDGPDWPGVVKELEKAEAILSNADTEAFLKTARAQALSTANQAAADAATQKSQTAEASSDFITAYEVLDDLPPDQRALVTARLDTLKDKYVPAAEQAATGLQKAHEPINGIGDESGIRAAYAYLQRCFRITNDPALQDRIAILGEDLSTYDLQQGKRYAEKPDGTGVNVGWVYLTEALQYKSPTDSGAIHDEMTTVRTAHLLKSRLSVKVDFRDQTSRRDAVDFATQLTDALATGLESSGLTVKVIRPQETTPVQPNFQLVGDVLQHEMGKSESITPKESMYRFGQEEIPNEVWNEANRAYEHANNDLEAARSVLQGAQAHGKKNEIKAANETVQEDEKKVEDLHARLDEIPKLKRQDVERPYTYSQVTYRLKIAVGLQFRILDSSGEEVVQRIPIQSDDAKEYSVLQNVKPEDTKGVRNEETIPNENEFLEQDEYKARDALIAKAKERVTDLPVLVLSRADRKASDGDNDGAAELYILYLNSTPVADTAERSKARKFLADQFNFRDIGLQASSE